MRAEQFQNRGDALGQRLSRIFHPILLNIVMYLIVGYYAMPSRVTGLAWAIACVLAQVIPPMLFFRVRAQQGTYSDKDVSVRQQRNELYGVGLATVGVAILILTPLGLPRPFLALLLCALTSGLICGLINLRWKISIHATAIASAASVALFYSPSLGVALWLCALAVGWARVRTRNHTPLQVLAGMAVATIVVLTVFQVLG